MSKTRKPSALQSAAMLRAEYRKWLAFFAIGLAICIIAIFVYMYLVTTMVLQNTGIIPWVLAVIAAGLIGWFGNKFSKAHRAYKATLDRAGLTDYDVSEYARSKK